MGTDAVCEAPAQEANCAITALLQTARVGFRRLLCARFEQSRMKWGDAPDIVAGTILEAATATAPRRRYTAGRMARQVSFLRRFVPESVFDKSLRKRNNLPG
jgi:hypothetical protein